MTTSLTAALLTHNTGTISPSGVLNMTSSRSSHAMASAINFINMLRENYSEEDSAELEKRFINAIRTGDTRKFDRGISHMRESLNLKKENKNV